MINKDPTVCYISFEYVESYENVTKHAISDWETGLKEYANNDAVWNIHYSFIQNNLSNDVRDNIDFLSCDIFIDFTDNVESFNGETVKDYNGNTLTTTSGHTVIQISISNELSKIELISTTTHELGHAFGLGHYITNEDNLIAKWNKSIDVPSIMIEAIDIEKITELDLKKMVSLYGNEGFEKLPVAIPEWIQNMFVYYGKGKINDSELINAIQYLAENGIISLN